MRLYSVVRFVPDPALGELARLPAATIVSASPKELFTKFRTRRVLALSNDTRSLHTVWSLINDVDLVS